MMTYSSLAHLRPKGELQGSLRHWHVATRKAFEKGFKCSLGHLSTVVPHGGLLPFQASWPEAVQVLRGALAYPPVLYLVSQKEAIFELMNEPLGPRPLVYPCFI